MDDLLDLVEARGYFLRREAIELGVDDRSLTAGVRRGTLIRIRQGAYCHRKVWVRMTDVDRHLARAHASHDLASGDAALSHISALADWGAPLFRVPLEHAHLTRLDRGSPRREAGVVHHVGSLSADEVVVRNGRRVTDATRSTVDALSLMTRESGFVAGDWMLAKKLTDFNRLWAAKTRANSWPDTRALEILLRLLDGRSESVGESRLRYLFTLMDIPMPELQYKVYDDDGKVIGRTDFAWPERRVFGEFDGEIKYGRALNPGKDISEVLFEEKQREDAIRRQTDGTIIRWIWTELSLNSAPSLQLLGLLGRLSA